MHPFALNDEVLDQIGGGFRFEDVIIENPLTPIAPFPKTPGEETTMAIGEEGGGYPEPSLA